MFGRTIKASIAKDNGRATEFIRRKVYKDKSRCYECGVGFRFCCIYNSTLFNIVTSVLIISLSCHRDAAALSWKFD